MKRFVSLSICIALAGCQTTPKKNFSTHLAAGQCEEALTNLPENQTGLKLVRKTQQAAGTALSYSVAGLGYTADALVTIAGGTVLFVALCGPIILAAGAGGGTYTNPTCLPLQGLDEIKLPTIGKTAYRDTASWRCPDLRPLSQSIEKVAGCYSSRNTAADLQKAKEALTALEDSNKFYDCLPEADRLRISEQLSEIKKSIAANQVTQN